jgi:hypothetical protein
MGCHYMDLPFWALGLRHPLRVEAQGPPPHPEGCPPWLIVAYKFPARGTQPPVTLTWYDGGKKPRPVTAGQVSAGGSGVLFVGNKGMLLADYRRHRLLPAKQYQDFVRPKAFLPESIGHHKEWIQACQHGGPTTCSFDYSGALTEAVLLGMVSYRSGQALDWDEKALRVTNVPEVERFLRSSYRKPWAL